MQTMDIRLNLIKDWLNNDLQLIINNIAPASADASFRRYFRAETNKGVFIIMDAPPEKESIDDFINISNALCSIGVHAPEIKAKDIKQGFLLLEDLGTTTYLDALKASPDTLYSAAIDSLIKIQQGPLKSDLNVPEYDAQKLEQEMNLFEEWYLGKHLNLTLDSNMQAEWQTCKSTLIEACLEQPQTWVHRDYHSRNLMVTEQDSPGVIDFQDMVIGPISYDLASIFKDCYIEWPRQQQLFWLEEYRVKANKTLTSNVAPLEQDKLIKWFDLTALQRHLKVLGIFCRLSYRDGKDQYLQDLPLVAKYTLEALSLYPEFDSFKLKFSTAIEASMKGSTTA